MYPLSSSFHPESEAVAVSGGGNSEAANFEREKKKSVIAGEATAGSLPRACRRVGISVHSDRPMPGEPRLTPFSNLHRSAVRRPLQGALAQVGLERQQPAEQVALCGCPGHCRLFIGAAA